jgi:hypothetical protein
MNLVATKTSDNKNKQGQSLYKEWQLKSATTQKVYGRLIYNSYWAKDACYAVTIDNQIHNELGSINYKNFATKEEALTWAREQIESLSEPTVIQYQAALDFIKDARYQDEMSDDFAYSNGKITRWDRITREINTKMDERKAYR